MPLTSRTIRAAGALLALVITAAWPVRAHHTIPPGRFQDTFTDVQGVVKEVRLTPPHAWIMLEAKGENGETQLWPLEGASPATLLKIGVTADYVKAGDTIKARCRRLVVVRSDFDCILGFVKARNGSVKDWSGNNAPGPTDRSVSEV